MRKSYDFSRGVQGAVLAPTPGKSRITIRIDNEVLDWFRDRVEAAGGGSYQSEINLALREHVRRAGEGLESTLRKVVREELDRRSATERRRPSSVQRVAR